MSAERTRADRLKRLLDVQERRRRLAEWTLADLNREAEELAGASAAIIESLGTQSLLNGLFLEAKSNALRRNEAQLMAKRAAAAQAAAALSEAQGMEKRVERAARDAETAALRREERDALDAALNDHLAAQGAAARPG